MSLNETIIYAIDNSIGCSTEPTSIILRGLALLGLMSLGSTLLSAVGFGISKILSLIVYVYAAIKWVIYKIRGKTI